MTIRFVIRFERKFPIRRSLCQCCCVHATQCGWLHGRTVDYYKLYVRLAIDRLHSHAFFNPVVWCWITRSPLCLRSGSWFSPLLFSCSRHVLMRHWLRACGRSTRDTLTLDFICVRSCSYLCGWVGVASSGHVTVASKSLKHTSTVR